MPVAIASGAALLGLCALLIAPTGADAQSRSRRAPVRPVVVELFTAQGCSSCPQANQMLGELAQRRGVIALTFPVDYWDYLGWADTFARAEFTSRQRAYVSRLKLKEIYTPEIVVSGRAEAPAVERDDVDQVLKADAARRGRGPAIGFARQGKRVVVGSGTAVRGGAELWLVRYDPTRREVKVRTGENAGKTVTHVNVVRELTRLGAWNGRARTFSAPTPTAAGLQSLVLLQGPKAALSWPRPRGRQTKGPRGRGGGEPHGPLLLKRRPTEPGSGGLGGLFRIQDLDPGRPTLILWRPDQARSGP